MYILKLNKNKKKLKILFNNAKKFDCLIENIREYVLQAYLSYINSLDSTRYRQTYYYVRHIRRASIASKHTCYV